MELARSLCGADDENTMHILVSCSFARLVWAVSRVVRNLVEPGFGDAENWLRGIHRRVDRSDFEFVALVCWNLWYNRNLHVFKGQGLQAIEVVEMARRQALLAEGGPGMQGDWILSLV
ncbi:UNVERIFIED_CONTAM: hypothetical protein Slati_3804500 [Sesamum latifolium]|uniref:Reverse transcriptase zinc-binding domain-containing protein n=1 Tax=Sesamum latifolium TaxID=2727402 RepID=A0AAW2U5Q8_9LAMI